LQIIDSRGSSGARANPISRHALPGPCPCLVLQVLLRCCARDKLSAVPPMRHTAQLPNRGFFAPAADWQSCLSWPVIRGLPQKALVVGPVAARMESIGFWRLRLRRSKTPPACRPCQPTTRMLSSQFRTNPTAIMKPTAAHSAQLHVVPVAVAQIRIQVVLLLSWRAGQSKVISSHANGHASHALYVCNVHTYMLRSFCQKYNPLPRDAPEHLEAEPRFNPRRAGKSTISLPCFVASIFGSVRLIRRHGPESPRCDNPETRGPRSSIPGSV
jgi:hypothetical protein